MMNRDQLHDLLFESANLTDAAEILNMTASNLRDKLKKVGLSHYSEILNGGQGADVDRHRRRRDGFESQTEWELYCYKKNCEKNRFPEKASKNPKIVSGSAPVWVAELNLESNK